ncbi:hypothetical protein BKA70DRAFT_1261294 [Coprinopsis sp. MPI-PUGE-AT-0042]|nr:hypothetical protein BKA70DRAFT_1261294 [Coprinopsis sp. MPI-PUGE-AT-0042]
MAESYDFIKWFQDAGGEVDIGAMGIVDFPPSEGGRGAVALRDLPEGHVLFTIPRLLTLSTRTSQLPELIGFEEWKRLGLHQGWVGLILCMMWEVSRGSESKWSGYMAILPDQFSTPMFWSENELTELTGTSIIEKLGKEDAERDWETKVKPLVKDMPQLFLQGEQFYSLEMYHIMGSRILSRSFTVEKWVDDEENGDDDVEESNDSEEAGSAVEQRHSDAMDVDEPSSRGPSEAEEEREEEDEDNSSDVAMVPMADMLNARYGAENAKLFYEEHELKMITTKPVKRGEQIWNTYGDPPNSDLLRRYGHVDVVPLSNGKLGNPADIVEVGADLVVDVIKVQNPTSDFAERIDWWLEEGGDDVFDFTWELDIPPPVVQMTKLLLLPHDDWIKARDKGKLPKPKMDPEIMRILEKALLKRYSLYRTSRHSQEDEATLHENPSINTRNAIIVRLAEKRILQAYTDKIASTLASERKGTKRKAGDHEDDKKRKSKR